MKREDILTVYRTDPKVVIKLINSMSETIAELKERVKTADNINRDDRIEPISKDKIKFFSRSIGSLVLLKPILERMKIAEIIDRICPADKQQILSHGKTVEMLVGNRLLSPQPLYRVEEWAKNAGIKEVWGIDSSLLNDDRIAKTLDAINSSRGAVKTEIALQVSKSFQIPLKQIHWDLTSFHFTGEYDS